MKNLMMFLLALTLFTSSTCEKEPSFVECSYTDVEAELYCEEGIYQFIGPDGKLYRFITTSDILKRGEVADFNALSNRDQIYFTNAANVGRKYPPICPVDGWWALWVGRQLVVDLHRDLNVKSIEILTPDGTKLPGKYTDDYLVTFGEEDREFTTGIYKYMLEVELESGTNIKVELEVKINGTAPTI